MKRIPSWKLTESLKKFNNKYDSILDISVKNVNTLNESDMNAAINLLEHARSVGWYPFVSEVYLESAFIEKYEAVANIKKDEILFEVLMLESEVDILSEFSDVDVEQLKEEIQKVKALM